MDVTSARYTRLQGDAGGVDAGSTEGAGPRSAGGWAGAGEGSLQPPKGRRTPSVNAPLPPLPQPENHPPVLPTGQDCSPEVHPASRSAAARAITCACFISLLSLAGHV